MLKIVIFDSGYGGELLADYLEAELPVMEIIRAIDWRHADKIQKSARAARKFAEQALGPYLGKVNLIIFANYLLSATSLKYFRRRYPEQTFLGIKPEHPCNYKPSTYVLTTSALARTIPYKIFVHKIKGKTLILDDWPTLIDDGELGHAKTRRDLADLKSKKPDQLILACSQFVDLEDELRRILGHNIKILNNFSEIFHQTCHVLKIRGGIAKQK